MTDIIQLRAASRRSWITVSAVTLATVLLLVMWLVTTTTGTLREQLKIWQPWSLDACVLLGLIAVVYVISSIDREAFRRERTRLVLLSGLGVALTLFAAPRTNRIFYDEQIYQGIGQNIADLRLAQMCNDGGVEYGRLRCASAEYNKQPYAYPHLLSLAYRVLGVHASTAFWVNAIASAATICSVYLLVCVAFRDRDAAMFAGLLVTLIPEQLLWSATAAVEPTASLACIVAVLFAAHYAGGMRRGLKTSPYVVIANVDRTRASTVDVERGAASTGDVEGRAGSSDPAGTATRNPQWPALLALVTTSAYAIQFRPESLLILLVIGLMIWPRIKLELTRPFAWWAVALFLSLVAVHLAHLFVIRNTSWGTTGPRFSFRYLESNLPVNGWFYVSDERFPVVVTVLAVGGLLSARHRRETWLMALYFLLFFAVTLVFYAGSYNYGADVRYSLMTYPPLAVLAGLGAAWLIRVVARVAVSSDSNLAARHLVRTVLVAILLFQFLWYAPVVRATTEEAWAARADVRFAQSFATEIPRNSYVLTHNPSMFHVWGVSAGQMSLVTSNPAYVRFLAQRYSGGLYLHWNFWCNAQDDRQQEICHKAFATAPVEVARDYRERDQHFVFYRMKVSTD